MKAQGKRGIARPDLSRIARVAHQAELRMIHLQRLRAELSAAPEARGEHSNAYSIRSTVEHTLREAGRLEVRASFRVALRIEATKEEWGTIAPTFRILYDLPAGAEVSEDEVKAFAEVNGVYNAWPYLRELVQEMTARMGVPALTIHLYKVQPRLPDPPEGAEDTSPEES